MKKIFSLILAFFALVSYAEEKTATFDFSSPTTLNPSLSIPDESGYSIGLVVYKFSANNGDLSMTFAKGDIYANTPQIKVASATSEPPYRRYLVLHRQNAMTISCQSNQKLTSVKVDGVAFGSIEVSSSSEGTYDGNTNIWTPGNDPVSSVTLFNNTSQATDLSVITVTYEDVTEPIAAPTFSPENNAKVSSFDKLKLTFDQDITAVTGKAVTLSSSASDVVNMTYSASGKVATITAPETVVYSGTEKVYTVKIPSGTFKTADNRYNSAITYTFTLTQRLATFKIAEGGLNPDTASTTITEYPTDIKITMADNVGHIEEGTITIYNRAGAEVGYCKLSTVVEDAKTLVHLKVTNSGTALANNDIYTLTIPEGYIYDWKYTTNPGSSTCNAAIKLTYNVGNIAVPTAAKLAEAKAVLDMKDKLGYPTATAMTTLQGYYDNKNVHDSDIDTEIANVKASADIVKPETGKSYTIANVAKDGTKRYLAYNSTEKKIESTTTASSAYKFVCAGDSFKVTDGDKTYHLTVLSDVDSYTLVKSTSLTEDKSDAAKLTVAHFDHSSVTDMTADNAWGKFSISGPLGQYSGTPYYAASTLNTHTGVACVYSPSTTTTVALAYDGDRSSLFEITEVEPVAPEVTVTTTPADGASEETLSRVTLTFAGTGVTAVNKASDCLSKITLKDSSDKAVSITSVEKDASSNLIYYVNFASLAPGTYTLTVGDGAFTQTFNNKEVAIEGLTSTFTVTKGLDFDYTFNGGVTNHNIKNCKAEAINDFKIWAGFRVVFKDGRTIDYHYKPEFTPEEMEMNKIDRIDTIQVCVDPDQTVYFADNVHDPVVKGHLERELDANNKFTGYVKLKWNKEITASDAPNGEYCIIIPQASFGDENFGKYIENPSSVSKGACKVNSYFITGFVVNTATGIQDVDVDADADLKDGKFMENGKIVIYRGGKRYSLSGMLLK